MVLRFFLDMVVNVLHRLPVKSGLTRLSFNPIVNRMMALVPEITHARLLDGRWIEVSTSDYHGRILYLFGTNDPKVELAAKALLNLGDVFLDIGANYSSIGLSASHTVGPVGAVHLFEPQKKLGDRVQAAIEAGSYTNVSLHRLGLMDRDAKLLLKIPTHHSGMATFAAYEGSGSFDNVEECEVREIGAYVAPLVAGRAFGAKLDIEGAEPAVMPWLLAQPNLHFLIFEAAHNQSKLYDAVRSAGLVLYGLKRHPFKLRFVRLDQLAGITRFHDLVAIRMPKAVVPPKESDPRRLRRLLAHD